jgi:hypothetical protein
MENNWDRGDKIGMFFLTILSCGIMAFITKEFAGIITDLRVGFWDVMMEFDRIVGQLSVLKGVFP